MPRPSYQLEMKIARGSKIYSGRPGGCFGHGECVCQVVNNQNQENPAHNPFASPTYTQSSHNKTQGIAARHPDTRVRVDVAAMNGG